MSTNLEEMSSRVETFSPKVSDSESQRTILKGSERGLSFFCGSPGRICKAYIVRRHFVFFPRHDRSFARILLTRASVGKTCEEILEKYGRLGEGLSRSAVVRPKDISGW